MRRALDLACAVTTRPMRWPDVQADGLATRSVNILFQVCTPRGDHAISRRTVTKVGQIAVGKPGLRTPFTPLFETLGIKVSQDIVFHGITDLERVAAHLTVFDVCVTVNREVQDHRDLFAAKGTGEGVFHDASTIP
jgi:hypothetical protein